MKFVFGLGNPGEKYAQTRHNIGFEVIDLLKEEILKHQPDQMGQDSQKFFADIWQNQQLLLGKPTTYMNDSGKSVRAAVDFYKEKNTKSIFIVHDDLDIPVGSYKIQLDKGPKVHNGLRSIEDHLKTNHFWRVRVGVDGRNGVRTMSGSEYVLGKFSPEEREALKNIFPKMVTELMHHLK